MGDKMFSKASTRAMVPVMIILLVTAAALTANNTLTMANGTSRYLPPEFKPEAISSVNKVASLISTDAFIDQLLSNPEMKEIISEINLDKEALKELLKDRTGLIILYTNTSDGPVYTIRLVVGKLGSDDSAKPLNNYPIIGAKITDSYIIDIKLRLKDSTLSIADISIGKNPLANVNYGPYPSYEDK